MHRRVAGLGRHHPDRAAEVGDVDALARAHGAASSSKCCCACGAQRSWRSRNSSYALRRGQSRGSRSSGRSGSMNGNRRHACTIAICVANVASGRARPRLREVLDERLVVLAQRRQVPRLVDHLAASRPARPARPGRTAAAPAPRRVIERLAIDVRRDPQPVAERCRTPPTRAASSADGAARAAARAPAAPAAASARPSSPARRTRRSAARRRAAARPRTPSAASATAARPARPRATPRACCAPRPAAPRWREPEPVQRGDQRLLPRPVGPRQQELAENREQRRAGGGRADGTASQDVFHRGDAIAGRLSSRPMKHRALG